ncbi:MULTISPECIES: hypothetical protein [Micrococcaceae]|nr:hypothetical protein [Arthrobacter sp. JUb115]
MAHSLPQENCSRLRVHFATGMPAPGLHHQQVAIDVPPAPVEQ